MAALAGSGPPPEGLWLWATEVDGEPGGVFTARHLPASAPRACGGDVVLRLGPGPGRLPGRPAAHVQAYAVLAGTVVLVAEWGLDSFGDWPEIVRVTAAFTMGVLTDLEARGADLLPHRGRRPGHGRRDGRRRPARSGLGRAGTDAVARRAPPHRRGRAPRVPAPAVVGPGQDRTALRVPGAAVRRRGAMRQAPLRRPGWLGMTGAGAGRCLPLAAAGRVPGRGHPAMPEASASSWARACPGGR